MATSSNWFAAPSCGKLAFVGFGIVCLLKTLDQIGLALSKASCKATRNVSQMSGNNGLTAIASAGWTPTDAYFHLRVLHVMAVCCYVGAMRTELLQRLEEVVWVDPDRLSGAPCFRGTRIPVQMLIDHLTAGFSLDEFLETVPSLERAQAQRFLELAGEQMHECASFLTSA
jgi:uncharacterized protein (DUF433 family)